jgi:hypothetical protein
MRNPLLLFFDLGVGVQEVVLPYTQSLRWLRCDSQLQADLTARARAFGLQAP